MDTTAAELAPAPVPAPATASAAPSAALLPTAPVPAPLPPSPSRFALYRQRQRQGAPLRHPRSAADLAALEAKPLAERTPQEKEAVRNHRKALKRQQHRAAGKQAAEVAAPHPPPPLSAVPDGASSSSSSSSSCLLPLGASVPQPAASLLALSGLQSAAQLSPTAASNASSAAAASTAQCQSASTGFSSSSHDAASSPLLLSAQRFAAAAERGTLGCPYKLHPDQQEALLLAVEERVARECAAAMASVPAASDRLPNPPSAPRLPPRDRGTVRSILHTLVTMPSYFVKLYAMLPRSRARKNASAAAADPAKNPVQQYLEIYEFVRDTGLTHKNRIGTDADSPDDCAAVRASLCAGSDMEEGAFTSILHKYVQQRPGMKVAHVLPQLLCAWAMLEETEGAECADDAMFRWCQEHRASLLDSSTSYIAFHWGQGHYCSLVLSLDVWRAGPSGSNDEGGSAEAAPAASSSGAAAAAAHAASSPFPSSLPPSKRRKSARGRRVAPIEPSTSNAAVPFLHLDTLPSHCHLCASGPVLRICRVFNRLCGTEWPEKESYWTPRLHLCGPPQQQDEWSCGYHLLRAWSRILASSQEAWTPLQLTRICAGMADLPLPQLVQEIRADFTDSEADLVLGPMLHPAAARE